MIFHYNRLAFGRQICLKLLSEGAKFRRKYFGPPKLRWTLFRQELFFCITCMKSMWGEFLIFSILQIKHLRFDSSLWVCWLIDCLLGKCANSCRFVNDGNFQNQVLKRILSPWFLIMKTRSWPVDRFHRFWEVDVASHPSGSRKCLLASIALTKWIRLQSHNAI